MVIAIKKRWGVMPAIEQVLDLLPDTVVEKIETSCCGMAGSFGYSAETYETSLKMGELELLPAVRSANADAIIVADGTSCRHQIGDTTEREAIHVARLLEMALKQDL
jgi:Fe-S oxidoreductase